MVKRVIVCSGKVYYDLVAYREKHGYNETAIIRVEQLYPLNTEALKASIEPYHKAKSFIWCQEESKNMGAWTFVRERIEEALPISERLAYAGRDMRASPAVGSMRLHRKEQAELLAAALDGLL